MADSTMSITEIIDGEEGRVVILSGAGLPTQGAAWGGEQILVTTPYPGNVKEHTQQILTAKEGSTPMQGEWRRNLLHRSACVLIENGETIPVVEPKDLRNILEDIFRVGHLLRVAWVTFGSTAATSDSIVRYGRAKSWTFPHDRMEDIKWSVTFEWKSREGASSKPVISRDTNEVALANKVSASLEAAMLKARLLNHHYQPKSSVGLSRLSSILDYPKTLTKNLTTQFRRLVNQFRQFGDLAIQLKNLPFGMTNTILDTALNTEAIANQFIREIGRRPYELSLAKQKAADIARAARMFGNIEDESMMAARRARELRDALAKVTRDLRVTANKNTQLVENDVLAVHVTRVGDTPENVSMRYYKSPDNGADILKANRMPWHQVTFKPGTPLIIPRIHLRTTASV